MDPTSQNQETQNRQTLSAADACTVRVWHCPAAADRGGPVETRCEQLLATEELQDAARFKRLTTRHQHIIGRAMARCLLCADSGQPQDIRFTAGEFGKPQVSSPAHADRPFNIAHTDGLVLCGIANHAVDLVGVDVESTQRRTSSELAERYFSRPEVAFLRRQPATEQQAMFLRIWTLKEAFIKAIGTGLHTPLADFAFHNIDQDEPEIEFLRPELDDGRRWKFVCHAPREGYIAATAVATSRANQEIFVQWHRFEPLLEGQHWS